MRILKNHLLFISILVILSVSLSGCVSSLFYSAEGRMKEIDSAVQATLTAVEAARPAVVQNAVVNTSDQTGGAVQVAHQAMSAQADLGTPDVRITLKTGMSDGKMVFIGIGGDVDGVPNPEIKVNPGEVVEITLLNGDNIQHNVAVDGFGVQSEDVFVEGDQTTVVFKADTEGAYPYYCTIPGHRQAGMEGKLVVGNPVAAAGVDAPDLSRAPDDLPGPLNRSTSEVVRIDLEAVEAEGRLNDGTAYTFWTFNGKVPGPFLRVRVGDHVEVHLKNKLGNTMQHSVDFHAVTGPGGGAVFTSTNPGEETMFTFTPLNPGVYVYHCATPMIPHHISNGMYGLILVEPEEGLPAVDREFYVMQGEIYTVEPFGTPGRATFSEEKLLDEAPEYFIVNGSVGALTVLHPLQAKVGETVRIYYGVGGPNFTSSFHVIGEIFDRVYDQASLTSPALTNVQTTLIPSGGATVVEFKLEVPGRYILVDHALSRLQRGLAGFLIVEGEANPEVIDGTPTGGSGH